MKCYWHPAFDGRSGFPKRTPRHPDGCPTCWNIHTAYTMARDAVFLLRPVPKAPEPPPTSPRVTPPATRR